MIRSRFVRIANLWCDEAIREYHERGYVILEPGPRAVDIPGFETPRYYDFIARDPVAGVNLGIEVKSTIIGTIRLNGRQVAKDVAVMREGGVVRYSNTPVRGVGYTTQCFGCDLLNIRSQLLREQLRKENIEFDHGANPGGGSLF